jgi:poly-gamma-glutamate capsule biosynthesis protein CapA/YwtB (metallophosphatase superfamily)
MSEPHQVTLFLSGDVMTGRGVDQILPHPSRPQLYEQRVTSALGYVALAEEASGPIPRPVDQAYVWGAALDILERERPDLRIINLETSITTSDDAEPKGINYRMHPENVPVLAALRPDCCVLANNHVLDWGQAGLLETLEVLARAGIPVAGAGRDLTAVQAPAVLGAPGGGRVLVFAFGFGDSGIPRRWAAGPDRPGVHRLPDFSRRTLDAVGRLVAAHKRSSDLAIASVHWGSNWGFEIPPAHRRFARGLIDDALIDLVHGHSSHHPKAIEVHRGRLILYGCGDFLNDYEGISRYRTYRNDLVVMYFAWLDASTGALARLRLVPLRLHRLRIDAASADDSALLRELLDRECCRFGHHVTERDGGSAFELE